MKSFKFERVEGQLYFLIMFCFVITHLFRLRRGQKLMGLAMMMPEQMTI